jgi:hypothetical protein
MKTITSSKGVKVELRLTPPEVRLIRAYRNLCDDSQELMLDTAEICAIDPMLMRQQATPQLRLVAGGRADA